MPVSFNANMKRILEREHENYNDVEFIFERGVRLCVMVECKNKINGKICGFVKLFLTILLVS